MDDSAVHPGRVGRRTLVKGVAWTVPAIAVATAVPAAAASGDAHWDVGIAGNCTAIPASRSFTVTAVTGTIPEGTTFLLSAGGGILDVNLLPGILAANALLGAVSVNGNDVTFSTQADLAAPGSFTIDVQRAVLNVLALSKVTLALVGSDNPAGAGAPNTAAVNTVVGVPPLLQVCA